MRTKQIDGQDCILVCGGPGFKVYSTGDNWLIVKYKTKVPIPPNHDCYKLVSQYVNLRYQPRDRQADIKAQFDAFLQTI